MKNTVNMEKFLDWLVLMDFAHYKTISTPIYTPTGNSHFYLKGSSGRFTSKELIDIFNNKADDELNERWQYSVADNLEWQKKETKSRMISTD